MADITPANNEPPVTTSTPETPGMKAAIDTLQPGYFKQPSKMKMLMAELVDSVIREIPFNLPLMKLAVNNLSVATTTPEVLVTALPFVQNMRLTRAFGDISSVPEGRDLVNMVQSTSAQITFNPHILSSGAVHLSRSHAKDGQWETTPGLIELSSFNTHGKLTSMLIHELQHRQQLLGGVLSPLNAKIPSPIETLWYDRVIEADAQATAIDIAYKMSKAGKPAAWEHEVKGGLLPHAVKSYQAAVEANPNAVNDGTAKRAAFDGWFQDSIRNDKPFDISRVYNNQGLSKWIGKSQIENLAQSGKPLAPLTHDDMAKIGALSQGTGGVNYLNLPGQRSLTDEYYRRPNWNQWEAQKLASMQRDYEGVKSSLPGASAFVQNARPENNGLQNNASTPGMAQVQLASISQDRLKAALGLTRPTAQGNAPSTPVARVSASTPRK